MKRNVLIFSGAPYPAIQICECLKYNMVFQPIAASSYSNHSEFVFSKCINGLPFIFEENFLECFIEVVKENEIEFIIPTDDTIALVLMENQDAIPAVIVCSPYETAKICRYKSLTYKALEGCNFVPKVYDKNLLNDIRSYPVFVKPDDGQGSQGTKKINNVEEFWKVDELDKMVIVEYLPGEEYTVDCFTDRYGKLLFCNPRSRSRIMHGITARGYNVELTDEFKEIIDQVNSHINFRGYWFAQLKRDKNGNLKLMELCTRFAGTFGVSKSLGANLPLMALCDFAEMDTAVIVNRYNVTSDKSFIDRYQLSIQYDRVYVDYDDTVTCENGTQINPYIIAYLYQCKNKGIEIVLISRHSADHTDSLSENMRKMAIPEGLFSDVIELEWQEEKSSYINTEKSSIFIDNSFAERKKVHDQIGIPVFDISNVDCLFDWR